jgi:glycosyltransferase involved in cell wall biosynthesis
MACGVPSVGFNVGGVPEAIRDGITGRVVPDVSAAAFAAGLRELLEHDDTRSAMGTACRQLALREFTLERQARDYVKLYEEIAGVHEAQTAR